MEEEKKKKRGWVKDAAIIFLAVLLVLTFFSNTILNRSLPEVATVYVQEGTITSKVRGTGTVTARENYEVTIDQTRKVQSVLVRLGDEVNVGDVLFTLQPGDSDELENAQRDVKSAEKTLKDAERNYQNWLLNLAATDYTEDDWGIADARDALEEARSALAKTEITEEELLDFEKRHAEADAEVVELEGQITEQEEKITDLEGQIAEKEAQQAELEAQLPGKEAGIEQQQALVDAGSESVGELDTRSGTLRELELQMRELEEELHKKEVLLRECTDALDNANKQAEAVRAEQQKAVDKAQEAYDEVDNEIKEKFGNHQDADYSQVEAAYDAYTAAKAHERELEKELEVTKVVYREDYQALILEATYLEYDDQASVMRDEAERQYRAYYGIDKNEPLSEDEDAEIWGIALSNIEARLGNRDAYTPSRLELYLPAAAEKHAADAMGMAYQKIKAANDALSQAADASDEAYEAYKKLESEFNGHREDDHEYGDLDRKRSRCKTLIERAQAAMDEAMGPMNAAVKQAEEALDQAKSEKTAVENSISDLNFRINQITAGDLADRNTWLEEEKQKLAELKADLESTKTDIETVKSEIEKLKSDIKTAESEIKRIKSEIEEAKGKHDKIDGDLEDRRNQVKQAQDNVKNKERALEEKIRDLNSKKEKDSKEKIRENIEQQEYLEKIEEAREDLEEKQSRVEELSSGENATEVRANVAGKLQELNVSAGHKAEAGQVLATIEVPDLGYSMKFTVTTEQARRLKVGDSATVSNYYWGSQIVATLVSIQTDPQNPQGSRIVNFDVTGDVTAGNSLTISVGERNANYDMVVPNSAVRSDTNGSFVLMITAKNSPLGNRYFATRVNVEVVASDEQYSAISGAIEAYDSVITTASRNAPIASGDQVRLADSNNG